MTAFPSSMSSVNWIPVLTLVAMTFPEFTDCPFSSLTVTVSVYVLGETMNP